MMGLIGRIFKLKEANKFKYPHEIYPDIIYWDKGDKIRGGDVYCGGTFIGVEENGNCTFEYLGDIKIVNVKKFQKGMINESLAKRKFKNPRADSYQQFVKNFRIAYEEAKLN